MNYNIPTEVRLVLDKLTASGFEAFVVGGCVRDSLLGKIPSDWDVTTNAKPDEIQKIFPDSVYENDFGTVGVKTGSEDKAIALIEVTPYRTETKYSDRRHPDEITFSETIDDDLKRRDFTINAMALKVMGEHTQLVDQFGGVQDLHEKQLRAVGDPKERFEEDALRLLRAIRLSAQLNFKIEEETWSALVEKADLIKFVAMERIRDEFSKLIASDHPKMGVELLNKAGLLKYIAPDIEKGIGVGQNLHHIYTVWEHNLRALQYAADEGWSLEVRMSALLHDVAKPHTKRGNGKYSTFYGHDVVGARVSKPLLENLRYSKAFVDKVVKLVRYHLFYYNVDEVTDSSVRRLIVKVGVEDIEDLIRLRMCDRIGSGVPKAEPYKLRHFRFMVEKLLRDPISVGMLKVTGADVMKLGVNPGPKIGKVLNVLLEDVLDDPKRNTEDYLLPRLHELVSLSDDELNRMNTEAKKKSSDVEDEELEKIKRQHHVK